MRKVARTDGEKEGQMFDCILMDLEMPGELPSPQRTRDWSKRTLMTVMDGLTSLRHIREEEKAGQLAHNLVIALSECLTRVEAHMR